ncbi:hypothetical protein BDV18DRAFT_142692 [Aspergillus unguis]
MNRLLPSRSLSHLHRPSSTRPKITKCCYLRTYHYNALQAYQPNVQKKPTASPLTSPTQKRTFLSSFIPSPPQSNTTNSGGNNGNNNNNGNGRILTATRTLAYPPKPLFNVISSVESYSDFLPFLTASTVTARDPETGYPSQGVLTVGYGPLSETFTSKVICDDKAWVVEARSGEKYVDPSSGSGGGSGGGGLGALASLAGFPGKDEGIFEYLSTKWELLPEAGSEGGGAEARTTVKLEIRFEFKSPLYASMFSAVEGQMAGIMIEAFEKRVREVHKR